MAITRILFDRHCEGAQVVHLERTASGAEPIRLNGTDFPIVGVFKKPPPEFFGAERDVWLPMDLSRARRFMGSSDWNVYAWLAPGVTQAQAQ